MIAVGVYFLRALAFAAAIAFLSIAGIGCDVEAPDVHLGIVVVGGVVFFVALLRELWRAR